MKGEIATVKRLLKGKSIARFGDGELKILEGQGYTREKRKGHLTAELRVLINSPAADCLIGIPTMDPAGPKHQNWLRHELRFRKYFYRGDGRRYYSAFISRPDSAADHCESQEYVDLMVRLWRRKARVTVLSEPDSKLLTAVCETAAGRVEHVQCPSHEAYESIDDLQDRILRSKPEIALLSCGPTATCLANRLAGRGVQAIDLGSIGGLLMRWIPGLDAGSDNREGECSDEGDEACD